MPSAATMVEIGQDEILTGEAVALDVQPAGFFLRLAGAAIDMIVTVAAALLVMLALGLTGVLSAASGLGTILSILLAVLLLVIAPTTIETATRGRSLGKLIVGARIVRADGGAAGFRQALIRSLVGVLEIWFTLGAVAALTGMFTPRAQRLGDLMAGTFSQRTRTGRLASFEPQVPAPLTDWARIADVAPLPAPVARRLARFVRQAEQLQPGARRMLAAQLATEAAASVSPVPAADPELFVRAVAALRFQRELSAIRSRDARATALLPAPREGRG
ncbi:RDD family protein [Microbacterium binotii]|uniref:RDD family protein n=1 Tax=Microbacterium binotii TaxID=462710 RepID=A0ABN3P730_9MICO